MHVQIASHTTYLAESLLQLNYILKTFLRIMRARSARVTFCTLI